MRVLRGAPQQQQQPDSSSDNESKKSPSPSREARETSPIEHAEEANSDNTASTGVTTKPLSPARASGSGSDSDQGRKRGAGRNSGAGASRKRDSAGKRKNDADSSPSAGRMSTRASSTGSSSSSVPVTIPLHDEAEGTWTQDQEVWERFQQQLKARGWELAPQDPDGNCLFRSISYHVYGDPGMHLDIRRKCIDFMRNDRSHFREYITEDFDAYMARKALDGTHANNPEIQAVSELFNRPTEVYVPENGANAPINIFHGAYNDSDCAPMRLLYTGRSHYDAIVDPSVCAVGQGLGIPGLSPEAAHRATLQANVFASDLEATEKEMEQAAIAASLQSFSQNTQQAKKKRRGGNGGGGSASGVVKSENSSSYYEKMGKGSPTSKGHGKGKAPLMAHEEDSGSEGNSAEAPVYPVVVQEMLMNGFSLEKVLRAYDLVGDNVDEIIMVLLQNST